jgi:hypothetical protein
MGQSGNTSPEGAQSIEIKMISPFQGYCRRLFLPAWRCHTLLIPPFQGISRHFLLFDFNYIRYQNQKEYEKCPDAPAR